MSQRDTILGRLRELPALPVSVTRVIALAGDPDADTAEIIHAIELDPGLTTNVLRVANSAYFAGPRQIGSIRDALLRLGMKRIIHLAMTAAVAPVARQPVQGYDLMPGELLRHSMATAIACEELAVALDKPIPDNVFTAGLLHDIGKIVLGTFIAADPVPIMRMAFEEKLSFETAEARVLGTNHAEVGAELLAMWNLPEAIVEAARWHHEPERAASPSATLDLVHMANLLVMMGGIGTGSDGLNYHTSVASAQRLEASVQATEQALSQTLNALGQLQGVFEF